MYLQALEKQIADILSKHPHVTAENGAALKNILTLETAAACMTELQSNPALLEKVARQSYRHTLGFDKFTLIDPGVTLADGARGYGWQLRLHIWWPGTNKGVPIVESMHEHSFDFVSTVLAGEIENQRFRAQTLTETENAVLEKLRLKIKNITTEEKRNVNDRLEALFALKLGDMGSNLPAALNGKEHLEKFSDKNDLLRFLSVTENELDSLLYVHDRFEAVSSTLKKGEYIHQLKDTVMLVPVDVQKISAGESYFHPHNHIHRLFNQDSLQATLLVTTPVSQDSKGGSLQRPTYVAESQKNAAADVMYARQMYSAEEVADILKRFLENISPR